MEHSISLLTTKKNQSMLINKPLKIICLFILIAFSACKQSSPDEFPLPEEKGDLYFSGYYWNYKDASTPVGPGPNRFLGTNENAWVDTDGNLHLKIAKKDNFWYCSEIISTKEFGYGTYVMTSLSDISTFNEKYVFGFFTWSDYSFQTDGNSEVDIEFSRWNNPNDSLLFSYAVQPVIFSNPQPYKERTNKPLVSTSYLKKASTHMMRWTRDSIVWESYEGENYPGSNLLSKWSFNNSNIPRTKIEGNNTSDPIIIPKPDDSTNVRFNFWLLNGQAPSNNLGSEIVIKSFKYTPL